MVEIRRPSAPGWLGLLGRDEEAAWQMLAAVMHELRAALEHQLEHDADLSFIEYYTLAWLSEDPDHRLRMSELAAATTSSLSRLSHMIKRLEARGFVRREPDPTDGRATLAVLTRAGHAKVTASAPAHVETLRATFLDEFTGAELRQLRDLCRRITARVEVSKWRVDPT